MKPSKGGPRPVHIPDKRQHRRSIAPNGHDDSSTMFPLSREYPEQHRGDGLVETNDEEDKFNSLVQMGRDLAHQLNNLLTTILANTQLMSLIVKDEDLKPYLRVVENATRDAGVIVRDFQRSVQAPAAMSLQEDRLDGTQQPSTEE